MAENNPTEDCSQDGQVYTLTTLYYEIMRNLARATEPTVPRMLSCPVTNRNEFPNTKGLLREATSSLQDSLVYNENHITTLVCVLKRRLEVTTRGAEGSETAFTGASELSWKDSSSSAGSADGRSTLDSESIIDNKNGPDTLYPFFSSLLISVGRIEEHDEDSLTSVSDIEISDFVFDNEHRTFVNTFEKLGSFLSRLVDLPASTPEFPQLAADAEGLNMGRFGSLTLLQVFFQVLIHTYVFDILTLGGKKAFDYKHENGWSLGRLMSDRQICKIMWDPRQDQDAMWSLFGIELGGIMCLQLVELVVRDNGRDRQCRMKLVNCVSREGVAWMGLDDLDKWVEANCAGRRYFQEHGYGVFEQRPMPSIAFDYAAGDVDQMLQLWAHFYPRLTDEGKALVAAETEKCLQESMLRDKPEGSGFAPEAIQKLPIIPWIPPQPEETDEEEDPSDEEPKADEQSGWVLESEQEMPEWERRALETVGKDWSATPAQETPKSDSEKTWESAWPNTWDTLRMNSGEKDWGV